MILAVYTTLILTGHLLAVQWSNMIVNVTNVFTFLNIYHVFIFKIVVKTNMNMKIPARTLLKDALATIILLISICYVIHTVKYILLEQYFAKKS